MGGIERNYEKLFQKRGGTGPSLPEFLNGISFFDTLAGGDILKYEQIEDLPYLMCLNKMTLLYFEGEIQKEIQRQEMKKMKR